MTILRHSALYLAIPIASTSSGPWGEGGGGGGGRGRERREGGGREEEGGREGEGEGRREGGREGGGREGGGGGGGGGRTKNTVIRKKWYNDMRATSTHTSQSTPFRQGVEHWYL